VNPRHRVRKSQSGRQCGRCNQFKLWSQFYANKRHSTGHQTYCKACTVMGTREWRYRVKLDVVEHYGGKCWCCGESESAFLTLDHVNNDGADHRREITGGRKRGANMWDWAQKNGYPDRLRLACFNCNCVLQVQDTCPHQARR
jgi:hypothetical protein